MPTLNIGGRKVKVGDEFLSLTPEQQADAVDEIAQSIGIQPQASATADVDESGTERVRGELSAMTQNPAKALYDQRPEWQKPLIAAQDMVDLGMNGLTMGFGNKAAAAGRSLVTGESYDDELQGMKAKTQAARDRSGLAGDFAEIGGAVATPMALASKGATLAGRFGSGAAQGAKGVAARAGVLSVEGGAYGGLSAAGNDTDIGQGVALGAIGGAAIPIVSGVAGAVAKPVVDAIKARINPGEFAAKKVAERVTNSMSPAGAASRMAANPGSNLADVAGKSTRDLLRTAVNIPGKAKDRVATQLTLRQFGQGDRLKAAISKTFGDPDGYLAAKDEIADEAKRLAAPLYKKAYAQPVHFSEDLEGILKTPAGQAALRHAETLAGNEQIPFAQMFVKIADDGSATGKLVPDTRGWDYIKRAMDDMIDSQTDSITKKVTNEGRILVGLKNRMLSEVDKLNPDYAAARKAYAGQAQLDEALEAGRDIFKASPEGFKRTVAGMTGPQKATARVGAAETLRAEIDRAGVTHNSVLRIFSKPTQMKNLQTLFETPEQFAEFRKAIFSEARKRATYDNVRGNSTTAAQMADMMDAGGLKDTADAAKTLVTQGPVSATLQWVGSRLKMLGGLTPEVADQIAKRLMTSSPEGRAQLVQEINRIEQAQISSEARRQAVQAFLARSLGVGAGAMAAQ